MHAIHDESKVLPPTASCIKHFSRRKTLFFQNLHKPFKKAFIDWLKLTLQQLEKNAILQGIAEMRQSISTISMETSRLELPTSWLQTRRSPN